MFLAVLTCGILADFKQWFFFFTISLVYCVMHMTWVLFPTKPTFCLLIVFFLAHNTSEWLARLIILTVSTNLRIKTFYSKYIINICMHFMFIYFCLYMLMYATNFANTFCE